MCTPRFLVVSLGNQAPYYECLHSAGHFALAASQRLLTPSQPPFSSERHGGKSCLVSPGQVFTMVQSPTMMNICGPWVVKTWREMLANHQLHPSQLGLVVVHDDLEEDLATVKIRQWKSSHRGHNGVKSILASLKPSQFPGTRLARISIGIGRPDARDQNSVSDYVLKKMTRYQKDNIENRAGPGLVGRLRELHDEWEEENDRAASQRL
ncbi:peptidyl-tRNA hydrolase [Biscogniauxia mediterranea]|nr:peptidyl-tRNA hydrolase [Biscogniauxia mediterranea]